MPMAWPLNVKSKRGDGDYDTTQGGGLQEGLGGGFPVIWSGMAAMEGENFAGSGGERAKNGGV